MSNVGYATLQIIPSMQGFTPRLAEGLAPELSKAGLTAGRKMGQGISTGAKEGTKTTGLFTNVEKGAEVAGVGAGRRFGTALHETISEYGKTIGATMVGFFAYEKVKEFLTGTIEEARKAAASERITEAIIKSTGEAAHVTAGHIDELSNSMSKKTGIDKTSITQSENMLLTFKGVRNEVGKGNDIFDQASQSILDIATVMAGSGGGDGGNSFSGAAKQLGKALNDPIKGISALTRVGVTFNDQQKTQIKNLVTSGHTLDAQKIILHELQSEFGGAAAASGDSVSKMTAAFHVFEEELGKKALPTINNLAQGVTTHVIPALAAGGDATLHFVDHVSKLPAVVKDLTGAFLLFQVASKVGVITSLTSAFGTLRAGVQLTAEAYTTARASQGVLASGMTALASGASLTSSSFRRGAAGVAGMAIAMSGLTSSSHKTVSALSSIASGGLLGFAAGGAFGAAVGLGVSALGVLMSQTSKTAEAEKGLDSAIGTVTSTLNQQTGAITANTVAAAEKALADNGVYDAANKLGISLGTVTQAYLGNPAAVKAAQAALGDFQTSVDPSILPDLAKSVDLVSNAVGNQGPKMSAARRHILEQVAAQKALKTSNKDTASTYESYADKINAAKNAIYGLVAAENKQRLANLKNKQDRLSLIEQMQATAKQAHDGGKAWNENTKKGQENRQALFDLAQQWDNTSSTVRNAKGEYKKVRDEFVQDARQMGATKTQAQNLANQLLQVPKSVATQVKTPGMAAALEALSKLQDAAARDAALRATVDVYVATHQANDPRANAPGSGRPGNQASGTDFWRGGPTWVGETGAELVTLPRGSQVIPHNKATASSSSGPQRVTLDFGAGRTLTGWIQDEISSTDTYRRTTGRRH